MRLDLQDLGQRCGKNRIAQLMRESGLRPKQKRASDLAQPTAGTLIPSRKTGDQGAHAGSPGLVWQNDFTYIETAEGWLFLAFALDTCTRWCVAQHCRPDRRGELTTTTLALALRRQPPPPGLLHHSDRGVQYAAAHGLTLSMSRTANPYDNAMAASFVATLNTECFPDAVQPTRAAAELLAFDYIEAFYNRRSRHSSLGYRSPIEFENELQSTPREGCSAGSGSKGGETCPEKQVGSSRRKQPGLITEKFPSRSTNQ